MENQEQINTWVWKKTSQKGLNYLNGAIEIDGKEYWVNIFKNNKQKDIQPDYNLVLNPKEPKPKQDNGFEEKEWEEVDF